MRQTIYAVATLIGMIVGVGLFGVPYITAKAGFVAGIFWILFLGGISLLVNLFYSEVALATPGKHRLVGYANYHLGKFWKYLATVTNIFSFWGAQIAYILIGGKFLYLLLGPTLGGQEILYNTIFFAVMALLALGGLRLIEGIELGMTALLILVVILIFGWEWPKISWQNFSGLNWSNVLFPYGVVLFALAGAAAVPEMLDIVKRKAKQLRRAVVIGTLISVLITLVFTFAVVGVTGSSTSEEALEGLKMIPNNNFVVTLGLIFGLLAIATSLLVLGLNLQGIFHLDYRVPKSIAWFLAVCVPFLVFLLGATHFIGVIDFTGSIFGGLDGIIIIFLFIHIFKKSKNHLKSRSWLILAWLAAVIFLLGIFNTVLPYISISEWIVDSAPFWLG